LQHLSHRNNLCRPPYGAGKATVVFRYTFKVEAYIEGPTANNAHVTIFTGIDSLEEFQHPAKRKKTFTDELVMVPHFLQNSGRNVRSPGLESRRTNIVDLCFKQTRKTAKVNLPHRKEFAIELFHRTSFCKKVEELFEHFPQARFQGRHDLHLAFTLALALALALAFAFTLALALALALAFAFAFVSAIELMIAFV
jgi:hypothetical protein